MHNAADERFEQLVPKCQKAVKKALWHCQQADQEDATQVALIEVWKKLNEPETAGNTDSWFIQRSTLYARDYATRMVYRHQDRHIPYMLHEDENVCSVGGNVATPEPTTTGQIDQAEELADYQALLGRFTNPIIAHCAWLLSSGWNKSETTRQLGISRKAFSQHIQELRTTLR